jgi:hypothetical protein
MENFYKKKKLIFPSLKSSMKIKGLENFHVQRKKQSLSVIRLDLVNPIIP